jgi:diguanylate cyclase (GGDEF)-like protein
MDFDFRLKNETKQTFKEQHNFIQNVIDGISQTVMVINRDYTVSLLNRSARSLVNENKIADKKHPKCYEISHHRTTPCEGASHPCPLQKVIEEAEPVKVIHNHFSANGEDVYVEITASPLFDGAGEFYALVESAHDITELINTQKDLLNHTLTLHHKVYHDELTGLPNRSLFSDRLEQAIKQSHRDNMHVAVFFIDLDRFKSINDTLGHEAGDYVLKEVAVRLQMCMREADTVVRMGGDEFTVIIDGLKEFCAVTDIVTDIAGNIIRQIQRPIILGQHTLNISCSMGISLYPEDGITVETLLRHADVAMYKAKNMGCNNYQFYELHPGLLPYGTKIFA